MRANKWGTPAEVIRYAANWLPPAVSMATCQHKRCATCVNFTAGSGPWVRVGAFCQTLGVATQHQAWCRNWEAGTP